MQRETSNFLSLVQAGVCGGVRCRERRDAPMDRKPPRLPMLRTLLLLPMLRIDATLPTLSNAAALATDSTLQALSTLQRLR
jgi:hypothetical protein